MQRVILIGGDTVSVPLFVCGFVDTLNEGFVLLLEKMLKNVSNSINTQMFLAGRICRWPFNPTSIHSKYVELNCV